MVALGVDVFKLFQELTRLSSHSAWGIERIARKLKKGSTPAKTVQEKAALTHMIKYLNRWDTHVSPEIGSWIVTASDTRILHNDNSRCFLIVLPKFEDIYRVANTLSLESTRIAIAYKNDCFPVEKMDATMIYTVRFPKPDSERTITYVTMIVLPTAVPFSTSEFFRSLQDITHVGCVLPASFARAITKTGWRSMQNDNWGKFRHIGLGVDKDMHPFLMRCNVAQAKNM